MPEVVGIVTARSQYGGADCIEWGGARLPNGYGLRKVPGTRSNTTAHRVQWVKSFGPIPPGLHVLHCCDNRLCITPEHLSLGTRQDNMDDMVRKRRQNSVAKGHSGESHHKAKLDWVKVRQIRAEPKTPLSVLATRYGVAEATIGNVRYGKHWKENAGA